MYCRHFLVSQKPKNMNITIAINRYDHSVNAYPNDLFLLNTLNAADVNAIRMKG